MDHTEHKSFKARWQQFFRLIRNPKAFSQYYFIDFHLDFNPEPKKFRRDTRITLIVSLSYAIVFGIYERLWAFTIFNEFFYENIYLHWGLWWTSILILTYFTTDRRWDQILMSLLVVVVIEDFTYWMVEWVVEKKFPFPAVNWWDIEITPFRVLGNWGTATTFWPYIPRFYYIVVPILLLYYLISGLGGPKYHQIVDWVLLPALIPFFIGFLMQDLGFIIVLITLGSIGYGWGLTLYIIKQKRNKIRKTP